MDKPLMKICPMCEKQVEKFKNNSHSMPEWMLKGTKDHRGRMKFMSFKEPYAKTVQNGRKGKFFCESCEEVTSKFDRFGASLFDQDSKHMFPREITIETIQDKNAKQKRRLDIWNNLDFLKTQKFIFSIILRHHLLINIKAILNDEQFKKMIDLYLGKIFDDSSFPILVFKHISQDPCCKHANYPSSTKDEAVSFVTFAGSGYTFVIFMYNNLISKQFLDRYKLTRQGSLYLRYVRPSNTLIWKTLAPSAIQTIVQRQNSSCSSN